MGAGEMQSQPVPRGGSRTLEPWSSSSSTPLETPAIFGQTVAALAAIFESVKSICGCRYKPPASVETPAIFDPKTAIMASVFDSERSVCGCLFIPLVWGETPAVSDKIGACRGR